MTSTSDELKYLQPSFNPASFTTAKLRNVLNKHEIDYPSDAKKPQLITLFNEHIAPNAAKWLDDCKNVEPSADGIVDASPPPRLAKGRRAKKSTDHGRRQATSTSVAKRTLPTSADDISEAGDPKRSKRNTLPEVDEFTEPEGDKSTEL